MEEPHNRRTKAELLAQRDQAEDRAEPGDSKEALYRPGGIHLGRCSAQIVSVDPQVAKAVADAQPQDQGLAPIAQAQQRMVEEDLCLGVNSEPPAPLLQATEQLVDALKGYAVRLPAVGRRAGPHLPGLCPRPLENPLSGFRAAEGTPSTLDPGRVRAVQRSQAEIVQALGRRGHPRRWRRVGWRARGPDRVC